MLRGTEQSNKIQYVEKYVDIIATIDSRQQLHSNNCKQPFFFSRPSRLYPSHGS
jgi:hypothetical protein